MQDCLAPPNMEVIMTNAQILKALAEALQNPKFPRPTKGKGKHGRAKFTEAEKEAFKAQNDAECVKAFTKAGYRDVQPRVNVMTYGKRDASGKAVSGWLAQGRMVRKGEKAIKVGPFSLFHVTQTDPLVAETVVQPNAEAPTTVQ